VRQQRRGQRLEPCEPRAGRWHAGRSARQPPVPARCALLPALAAAPAAAQLGPLARPQPGEEQRPPSGPSSGGRPPRGSPRLTRTLCGRPGRTGHLRAPHAPSTRIQHPPTCARAPARCPAQAATPQAVAQHVCSAAYGCVGRACTPAAAAHGAAPAGCRAGRSAHSSRPFPPAVSQPATAAAAPKLQQLQCCCHHDTA